MPSQVANVCSGITNRNLWFKREGDLVRVWHRTTSENIHLQVALAFQYYRPHKSKGPDKWPVTEWETLGEAFIFSPRNPPCVHNQQCTKFWKLIWYLKVTNASLTAQARHKGLLHILWRRCIKTWRWRNGHGQNCVSRLSHLSWHVNRQNVWTWRRKRHARTEGKQKNKKTNNNNSSHNTDSAVQ